MCARTGLRPRPKPKPKVMVKQRRRGSGATVSTRTGLRPRPKPKPKVTVNQLKILLTAIEKDPSMYDASQSDMIAFLNINKWLDLSDQLNESYGGAVLDTANWKYVLRHWADNVKKGVNVMSRERLTINKANPAITLKEAKELTCLERRLYKFMKNEDAKEFVDVTYTGKFGAEEPKHDIAGASDNGITVKVHLRNVFHSTNDENARPGGRMKRIIHVKAPIDPGAMTKKLKVIFDANIDNGEPQKQILANQLERLQMVSSELVDHIATIQSRIHMIKDLWRHRCGDN